MIDVYFILEIQRRVYIRRTTGAGNIGRSRRADGPQMSARRTARLHHRARIQRHAAIPGGTANIIAVVASVGHTPPHHLRARVF